MKIGILTFHGAMNYGAVLQAYALQQHIEQEGHQCEIIDYACEHLKKIYSYFYVSEKSVKGIVSACVYLPIRLKKYSGFHSFRTKNLVTSKEKYSRANIKDINGKYDVVIVGSDQVWNPEATANDHTYFLDGIGYNTVKAAYAASLGVSDLTDRHREALAACLDDFSYISVRERANIGWIQKYSKVSVEHVIDPVFLLGKEVWKERFVRDKCRQKKYIFAYCLHEQNLYQYSRYMSEDQNMDCITVPHGLNVPKCGRKKYTLRVEQFLSYIYHAEYVVTDSFHALAFALIFHKNVRVVLKEQYPQLNTRMTELLKCFELEHLVINRENYKEYDKIEIDYDDVSLKMKPFIEKSKEYIKTITEETKDYESDH